MAQAQRFISESLDRRACDELGGHVETRSVFEVGVKMRTLIDCDELSMRIFDMARDPDDPHRLPDGHELAEAVERADDKLMTEVRMPSGYLFVGLGDIGTAANPVYGIISTAGLEDLPWSNAE